MLDKNPTVATWLWCSEILCFLVLPRLDGPRGGLLEGPEMGHGAVLGSIVVRVVIAGLECVGVNWGANWQGFFRPLLPSPGPEEIRCHHGCASVRSDL